ncbi:MAG: response regulator, partial [Candidatus Poribacteria bacterium]
MNTQKGRIAVVDDDQEMRSLLQEFFTNQGYAVTVFPFASDAIKALCYNGTNNSDKSDGDIDVVISDIKMPQIDGMDLLSHIKKVRPELPIILITAFGSIETAIEAMRLGAFHYIVKPFKLAEISVVVERALEHRKLHRENIALRQEVKRTWSLGEVIGKSQIMRVIFDLVGRVSQATANVLVTGESGTGKEMIARAIHQNGPRATKPFVAINCTAIPETLL